MTNKPKNIGTAAETAVVRYLRANGWANADRLVLRGRKDIGDITIQWPIVIELKAGHAAENASDGQVEKWLEETNNERLHADYQLGALVMKRKGFSAANAGSWWVVMEAGQYDDLRAWAGVESGRKWISPASLDDINPHLPVRFTLDHFAQCLRAIGWWDGKPAA
jgi:hypothetical protein